VLQKLQANTFLQAAAMTGMKAQFDLPGFTATVLAPSDAAFATLLNGTVMQSQSISPTIHWWLEHNALQAQSSSKHRAPPRMQHSHL